jgi:DNA-directed RNA polymerase beta' subunit
MSNALTNTEKKIEVLRQVRYHRLNIFEFAEELKETVENLHQQNCFNVDYDGDTSITLGGLAYLHRLESVGG